MAATFRGLQIRAEALTKVLPYMLQVKKESERMYSLVANRGFHGQDVIYVGSLEECDAYLRGMQEMLRAMQE